MMELVGKEVWLVNYGCVEFQDCNGIYSTREKAEDAVLKDAERCSDIWKDFTCVSNEEDFTCYEFTYDGPHKEEIEELQGATVEKMVIK